MGFHGLHIQPPHSRCGCCDVSRRMVISFSCFSGSPHVCFAGMPVGSTPGGAPSFPRMVATSSKQVGHRPVPWRHVVSESQRRQSNHSRNALIREETQHESASLPTASEQEAYAEHRAIQIWALADTENVAFNMRLPGWSTADPPTSRRPPCHFRSPPPNRYSGRHDISSHIKH